MHAPVYLHNMKYSKLITAFFDNGYDTDETKDILEELKKKKLIDTIRVDYVMELGNKGYNHNSINFIILNFSKTEMTKMLSKKHDADFEEYITLEFFNYDHYNRYVAFQKKNKTLSLDQVVIRVELDLDKDPYEDPVEEENPDSLTALVNKHRYISKEAVRYRHYPSCGRNGKASQLREKDDSR